MKQISVNTFADIFYKYSHKKDIMVLMEKILFSNNFNQTEYLRTLAKLSHDTFALRVMNDGEICSYILERSGIYPDGEFISSKEANYIFYHLVGGDFGDIKNLRTAIDSYRDCVVGDISKALDENLTDDFLDKKFLIKTQYQAYTKYKKEHNLYDKQDLINFIISKDIKLDIVMDYYEEFGISKLFLTMLEKVFTKVNKISLNDTFQNREKDIHFLRAFGKPCEVDYVFSKIQKYPVDECQIVVTNNSDALEIVKVAEMLHIPYVSHIGSPVISSKAGTLLNYLFNLENLSYGVDGFKALFNCPYFNVDAFKSMIPENKNIDREFSEFVKNAGWLRLNFDERRDVAPDLYKAHIYDMLEKLQDSLLKGRGDFINEYIVDPTPLDLGVIESIRRIEEASQKYRFDQRDVLKDYLGSYINKKISQSGCLYITDVNSALSSLRKHNFIIGLTSDFPGGPKENYLIFDEEYEKTGSDLYVSKEIVKRKEKVLRSLIKASIDLYLTYPYFELASLEDKNPSSVIFDLFKGDGITAIPAYGFKDMTLDVNKEVYVSRMENLKSNLEKNIISLTYDKNKLLSKKFSPSSFYKFFKEEYYLDFMLSNILGINIDNIDDPYIVIPSNEMGTLVHEVMEGFQKNKVSNIELLNKASIAFNNFLKKKPAMISSSVVAAKDHFLRLVASLYKMDPGNKHIYSERYIEGEIEGINFGGMFDRLEQDVLGNYIIIDYKTGRNVEHIENDPVTCLQGLIYAYLIENYGVFHAKINRIEFRYPEKEVTVSIIYNDENKQKMLDMMKEFKKCIEEQTLFRSFPFDKQKYIDKYLHLFSLLKGVNDL